MKTLGTIKANNPALHGGKNAADYQRLTTNDNSKIYAIERSKDDKKVFYIANLSKKPIDVKVEGLNGEYRDLMSGATVDIKEGEATEMGSYAYLLLEPVN